MALLWRDRYAGAALVRDLSQERLAMSYRTADLLYEHETAGDLYLSLVWKGSAGDNARPFACCPECPRHVDVLILKNETWCCPLCHRLKHRSAMIRKEIRWAEELAGLDRQLEASMTIGVSAKRRSAATARREELRTLLAGREPTASTSYLRTLRIEYVSLPEGWSCSPA